MVSKTIDNITRAGCCALAAAGVSTAMHGADGVIYLPNSNDSYSLRAVAAGASFVGSLLADLLHDNVFDHIPVMGSLLNAPMTEGVAVGVHTAALAGANYMINSDSIADIGAVSIVAEAGISRVAGKYAADTWVIPTVHAWWP